ncbi:MAG: hypothetical protein II998_10980 [Clostridia bacterium]|nr:hypothetical protein [Clostridia bacterium]
MYRRYYDGYARVRNDKEPGEVFVPQSTANTYKNDKCELEKNNSDNCCIECNDNPKKKSLFSKSFELDDLILIGVLIFILSDSDNDDQILPLIIGFVFLSGLI